MNVFGETLSKSKFLHFFFCALALLDAPEARAETLRPTSLDTSLPSVAFAASRFTDPDIRFHRQSENYSKPIDNHKLASTDEVFIEISPEEIIPFAKSYEGMRVRLLYYGQASLGTPALNAAIDLVQEAETAPGTWKPIESLPESCCGLGRTRFFLEPGHYWEFTLPKYSGAIPARIRVRFTALNGQSWVSSAYDGGYNEEQLLSPDEARSEPIAEAARE